ncbi:tyrosine-type recombinase/integrase [Achromobacter ruhlandii]
MTPHTFRDTYAARLVQAGVSILKVSKLLGHSNVLMTQK